jgi:hypothetical protein
LSSLPGVVTCVIRSAALRIPPGSVQASQTSPRPSRSASVSDGSEVATQLSHASPRPSASPSSCVVLAASGQLSSPSHWPVDMDFRPLISDVPPRWTKAIWSRKRRRD